jgi:hypothetical protein
MLKRWLLTGALLAAMSTTAVAAPMSGKVVRVQKQEVRLVLVGKPADWVKKGTAIKFLGARATILGVAKDTLTVSSPNAAKTKAGETVTFDKARATAAGC